MRKLLLVLLVISCLFLQSCGIKDFFEDYPLEKRGVLLRNPNDLNEDGFLEVIEYNNEEYYLWDFVFVEGIEKNALVLISWDFNIPFTMITSYHAYPKEIPPFISEKSLFGPVCFLHHSIDYMQELFLLDDTNVEIVFSDVWVENTELIDYVNVDYYPHKGFLFSCKEFPALATFIEVFEMDDNYYVQFTTETRDRYITYPISSQFFSLLEENDLLPEAEVIPQT